MREPLEQVKEANINEKTRKLMATHDHKLIQDASKELLPTPTQLSQKRNTQAPIRTNPSHLPRPQATLHITNPEDHALIVIQAPVTLYKRPLFSMRQWSVKENTKSSSRLLKKTLSMQ